MAKRHYYTEEERYKFHSKRDSNCGKFGIKFGSPKHCYSSGFVDAFESKINAKATEHEFGKNAGRAYSAGYARGRVAAMGYLKKTGKQPFSLRSL